MTRKRLIIAAVIVLVIVLGSRSRAVLSGATKESNPPGGEASLPLAGVARVERGTLGNTLTVAGEFKPFQEVDVHAKVAGFIRVINVDVGQHVTSGETLAVLEVPELAAQLAGAGAGVRHAQEEIRRAQSDVERAQSSHSAVHSGYVRLKQAADSRAGLVAQQEMDDVQAKDLEAEAQVASARAALSAAQQQLEIAQANEKQFAALSGYSRITAPFAGVITKRFADTGALIQAGTSSNTQAMPVVRLAQTSKLRLVLAIPESASGEIHDGAAVKVRVQALNQDFAGKVSRFADSLDRQTRTMETEIDFDNPDNKLIPGMYAEAALSLKEKKDALTIPIQAVNRNGDDGTVLVIDGKNTIEERHVKLGIEGNTRIEVTSGLTDQDLVVLGSRSLFTVGQKVQPQEIKNTSPEKEGGR